MARGSDTEPAGINSNQRSLVSVPLSMADCSDSGLKQRDFAGRLKQESTASLGASAAAFQAGVKAIQRYGGASKGDRTMLDALLPAADALSRASSGRGDLGACGAYTFGLQHCLLPLPCHMPLLGCRPVHAFRQDWGLCLMSWGSGIVAISASRPWACCSQPLQGCRDLKLGLTLAMGGSQIMQQQGICRAGYVQLLLHPEYCLRTDA